MKKGLLFVAAAFCMVAVAYAQPRAIGGRVGNSIEAVYQHSLGENNFVEVSLGMPFTIGVQATATYDWLFNISAWKGEGKFNWYAGVGAGAGLVSHYYYQYFLWNPNDYINAGFAGVCGHIGVEYVFEKIPLTLSVDYRPLIGAAFMSKTQTTDWGYPYDLESAAQFYIPGLYDFSITAKYIF